MELSRREVIAAGAAAGARSRSSDSPAGNCRRTARPAADRLRAEPDGDGWGRGWRSTGVANLRRAGGLGVLEAGSDVFPNDPRPVVFAVDCRMRDVEVAATIADIGSAPGVVVRRRSATAYYAAVYDTGRAALRIMRRHGAELDEFASTPVASVEPPATLKLAATGAGPTELRAELVDAAGASFAATARDDWKPRAREGRRRCTRDGRDAVPERHEPGAARAREPASAALGASRRAMAFMATPIGTGGRRRDPAPLDRRVQRDRRHRHWHGRPRPPRQR